MSDTMCDQPHQVDLKVRKQGSIGPKIFLGAFCAGFAIMLGDVWWTHKPPLEIKPLTPDISVTSQLQLRDVRRLEGSFATIIDLRPDGEAPDQPSSKDVESYCEDYKINFAYVPVKHGTIPDSSVQALQQAIKANPKPILLYCRSGKRAVRTFCLAEASRPGGASLESILSAAKTAGQTADDLTAELKSRIAHRSSKQEAKK